MITNRPQLIGISGPSGAGKSTLARQLANQLNFEETLVISLDDYYYDLSHFSDEEREAHNFDEPEAIESTLLASHVERLLNWKPVRSPIYDHTTSSRRPGYRVLEPRQYVVLEGLFTWHWPSIRQRHDLCVFVDASNETCLERRIRRDVEERDCTAESVRQRYEELVRPMQCKHLAPLFAIADVVLDGEHDLVDSAERIEARIKGAVQL